MNPFAVDLDLLAQLPSTAPVTVTTEVFVNVHRYPNGIVTAASHASVEVAERQARQINTGKRGGRVVGRVRVPLTCTEGQFDV